MMHDRAAVIKQLKQTQEMLAKLLALIEAGESDKFAPTFTSHAAIPGDVRAAE